MGEAGGSKLKKKRTIASSQRGEFLKDFNQNGDDAKKKSIRSLKRMPAVDRLAKLFPFYLMDINGFGERIM